MIIGIDASRASLNQKTGTEYYSYNLIKNLAAIDKVDRFVLYSVFSKQYTVDSKLPENFEVKILKAKRFWTQYRLSLEMLLHKRKLDVLFIPAHAMPLIYPKKTVVTIHGLEYEYFPESYSKFDLRYLRYSTKKAVEKATKIIAVSQNTKKDLIKFYSANPRKIEVVYNGFNIPFSVQYSVKSPFRFPYILFVGRIEKRKNIVRLINAFEIVKEEQHIPHKLLLVGKFGYGIEEILNAIKESSYKKDIVITGYVPEKKLPFIYRHADMFVFPSLYEGFGIPVLEAMAHQVPVLTSNVSSLPEVVGNAALKVNPKRILEMIDGIESLIKDGRLREDLKRKGLEQIKKFGWERCARETLNVLKSV